MGAARFISPVFVWVIHSPDILHSDTTFEHRLEKTYVLFKVRHYSSSHNKELLALSRQWFCMRRINMGFYSTAKFVPIYFNNIYVMWNFD
jgi:hypothetical protein